MLQLFGYLLILPISILATMFSMYVFVTVFT